MDVAALTTVSLTSRTYELPGHAEALDQMLTAVLKMTLILRISDRVPVLRPKLGFPSRPSAKVQGAEDINSHTPSDALAALLANFALIR